MVPVEDLFSDVSVLRIVGEFEPAFPIGQNSCQGFHSDQLVFGVPSVMPLAILEEVIVAGVLEGFWVRWN